MDNLQFRKFEKKDFGSYFQLVSNEMVMAQITERAIPLDEAKVNYQRIIDRNAEADMFGTYKIVENETFVGLGHLTSKTSGEAEIGYMILPEYWGKGYGTVIACHLIKLATLTNTRIVKAIIDPRNSASRKILLNQGFSSEKVCEMDGLPAEIFHKAL
ncbi:GNAT family N-acetyltransferase [Peribacillus sp. FSL H8-0477]|uniref:GNAT family N-acetyltransferase n=1 Tax=Peribacillus sp. FSL H8-0477 TaxID=2921388 RepID=UPI0030F5B722